MTVAPFVLGGVLMMIFALQGSGAFAFIYLLVGILAIPGLFLTRSIYKKIYYNKNPTIEAYSDLYVERTVCPKCHKGKIKYSKLFNNHSECGFFGFYGQIRFICLDCKTVYPEATLSKYFGDDPTFKYISRGKSYFKWEINEYRIYWQNKNNKNLIRKHKLIIQVNWDDESN